LFGGELLDLVSELLYAVPYNSEIACHFEPHQLRRNRDRGGRELPPKEVQGLLGHSSIVMTMDTYGHLFAAKSDRAELSAAVRELVG
jgi:integrase